MFNSVHKAFHEIAPSVLSFQQAPRCGAAASRRNDRLAATVFDLFDELVAVVAFVRDYVIRFMIGQQARSLADIVLLPWCKDQFDGTALRIYSRVDLGAETAARPAERLVVPVFLMAPAAC